MKYVFLNDICILKKSIKVIIIYFLFLLLMIFIMSGLRADVLNIDDYKMILGLQLNANNMLSVGFYLLNILLYYYLYIALIIKDVIMGNLNLFLRINLKKWIFLKFVSFLNILTLLKIIFHIMISYFCNTLPVYVFQDILFIYILVLISLLFNFIFKKSIITLLFIIVAFCLSFYYKFTIISIKGIECYIIFIILLLIMLLLLFNRKLLKLGGNR